ncbi:oxygenase MpaB family protein [Nocardia nepalensis]|uniref:oxygenase MpaB family protein n=1 Tax=Nocardia nepalensis TaxID=3375448 RepID=UPI003B6777F8
MTAPRSQRGHAFDQQVAEARPLPVTDDAHTAAPPLGADSLIWKFYGDVRVQLFGFQRLASTENSIAQLAQAVSDHSVIFGDFLGRAKRTAVPVLRTVYGPDPHDWGRTVRDFHKPIKGTMPDGSRYHALNPELFYWAHATFIDQILYNTDTFIRRLSYEEKARIFDEGQQWYRLYGVSCRNQPQTYDEFLRYWDDMLDLMAANPMVRYGTGYIRKGIPGPPRIPRPAWKLLSAPINGYTRTMIVGTLPPQTRAACGLPWNDRRERRFQRIAAAIRAMNPALNRLPIRLLYAPWAVDGWKHTGVDPRALHN